MNTKPALILAAAILLAAVIYVLGTETEYEQCVKNLVDSGGEFGNAARYCAMYLGGYR